MMATARMLSTTIAIDAQLARLSERAEWMYLKCIPHLDRDGMITGEPMGLLGIVSPMRFSEVHAAMAGLVEEWVQVGLVLRFVSSVGPVLFFKGFLKQQSLKYSRERPSQFPCPPGYMRTAEGLKAASEVPWAVSVEEIFELHEAAQQAPSAVSPVESGKTGTFAGFLPENPDFCPQQQQEQQQQQQQQQEQQQEQQQDGPGEAAAAGPFSDCRLLLVDFGVSEPSLGRILAKRQGADHVRGWLVEATQASQRRRKPIDDPVAFAVARLLSGDPPARLVSAEEYEADPDDDDEFEALKRRYVPQGWEDVVMH